MALLSKIANRFEKSCTMQALQQGLVMNMPLLTIGSFAMILQFLPFFSAEVFQNFFLWVNRGTFGILGITCTVSISFCYARLKSNLEGVILGNIFTAVSTSLISNGFFLEGFDIAALGTQGMCNSIFSALFASVLYFRLLNSRICKRHHDIDYASTNYNRALAVIIPVFIVIGLVIILNNALLAMFSVRDFEELFQNFLIFIFSCIDSTSIRTLLYIALSGFLWFFGIHGINVLNGVDHVIFPDGLGVHFHDGAIITKPFMDVFVSMGGSGATISLLLAICLFSKQKTNRKLAKMAALPMLFNVNELMLFGLPMVLNRYFFIPFLITPLVFTGIAYAAIWLGLVPAPELIHWITPVLIGGYKATGSFSGVVLQIVNILVGTFIYRWFLRRYEKATDMLVYSEMGEIVNQIQVSEADGQTIDLLNLGGSKGLVVRMLIDDLRQALLNKEGLELYYQPQYNNLGECVGAEALLRWDHPRCGKINPCLMIQLAKDDGFLACLEKHVLNMACRDIERMISDGVCPPKVCVNVTATTLQSASFHNFLEKTISTHSELRGRLCLELTEQMSFMMEESSQRIIKKMRNIGIIFAVDDFSMGHTSLKYLQTDLFDMVKLDGAIVKGIMDNARSKEIVSSIINMSQTLVFTVVAEYVETIEQQLLLEKLGCYYYQGYLYSPALPYDKLGERMEAENSKLKKVYSGHYHNQMK